jgi:hypothetical protein
MAREVRVGVAKQSPAEPDFPKTILKEFQTNEMSADGTGKMAAHRPKKIPLKNKKSAYPKFDSRLKRFGRGLGEPFLKRFPQETKAKQ